jgi:hypothetical protein
MKYSLFIQKNKILAFVTTWMNAEDILVSEISLAQKDKCLMIICICGTKNSDLIKERLEQCFQESWRLRHKRSRKMFVKVYIITVG